MINLSSGNPAVATVPANITIPQGGTIATFTVTPAAIDFGTAAFSDAELAAYGKFITADSSYNMEVTCKSDTLWTVSIKTTGDFTRSEGGSWTIPSSGLKVWGWYNWPQPPAGSWVYPSSDDPTKLASTALATSDTTLYRSAAGDNNQEIKLGFGFGLWIPVTIAQGTYQTQVTITMTE